MRYGIKHKRIYIVIGFISLIMVGGYKICRAVFLVNQVEWCFDPLISELGQKSIIRFASDVTYDNFSLFTESLKKKFSVIKDVTLLQKQGGILMVSIKSVTPKMRIGNQWIISREGVRVRSDFFNKKTLKDLTVIQECADSALSVSWIFTLSPAILARYNITWADNFHVWLQDKEQNNFVLLIEERSLLSKEIIKKVERVKQNLYEQGAFSHLHSYWVADMRFKDHIIVSKKRGKVEYGT